MNTKTSLLVVTIAVAILLKSLLILRYFEISGDKIYQAAAAQSLANGHGYSVPLASVSDLSRLEYKPMVLWPPAYSLLLAPLISLAGSVPLGSSLVDLLNGTLFIVLVFYICRLMSFPAWLTALLVLFKATEINDVVYASTPTDYMALNGWLLTVCLLIRFLQTSGSGALWLFALVNAINPWIRYASIPVVVVLPLGLIIAGYWNKRESWKRSGLVSLAACILSTGILLLFNYLRSGQLFYVLQTTKGFYPSNLLYLPPVVWMSLLDINFILTQLSLRTGINYDTFSLWLRITNGVLLVILGIMLYRSYRNWMTERGSGSDRQFLMSTGLLVVATMGSLSLLSVTRSRNFQVDQLWTYIEEPRYMLLITTFISFYLVHELVHRRQAGLLRTVIILIMTAHVLHGVWVIAKGPLMPIDDSALLHFTPRSKALVEMNRRKAEEENRHLVVMDEDYNLRGYSILKGIPVFDDPNKFDAKALSLKPVNVLFRIRKGHESLYPGFFREAGVIDLGLVDSVKFYMLRIDTAIRNN